MKKIFFLLPFSLFLFDASALEHSMGRTGLRLTGYGIAGFGYDSALADFKDRNFLYDYRLRGQVNYAIRARWTVGAVYAIDRLAIQTSHPMRDAFAFVESPYGRVEAGFTDTIAAKLGVGLPDVGGLRMNDNSLAYNLTDTTNVISSSFISGTRYGLRVNVVSVPTKPIQSGASISGLSDKYDYAYDIGIKFRDPNGKTKTALSLGASRVEKPRNFGDEIYLPRANADNRTQIAIGANLQYNSFVLGAFGRGIYDQNPIGQAADGIIAGIGGSYDFLKFSVSLSYIYSEIGLFHKEIEPIQTHTGVLSLRYKINKYFDGWTSNGVIYSDSSSSPFFSAGIRTTF
jgi:hypothetical protein